VTSGRPGEVTQRNAIQPSWGGSQVLTRFLCRNESKPLLLQADLSAARSVFSMSARTSARGLTCSLAHIHRIEQIAGSGRSITGLVSPRLERKGGGGSSLRRAVRSTNRFPACGAGSPGINRGHVLEGPLLVFRRRFRWQPEVLFRVPRFCCRVIMRSLTWSPTWNSAWCAW